MREMQGYAEKNLVYRVGHKTDSGGTIIFI